MRIAFLPFNATDGTSPALARQLAFFASEMVRMNSGEEVAAPRFQTQIEEGGIQRMAYVNVADVMLENEMLDQMFQQLEPDLLVDGLLHHEEGSYKLSLRFTPKIGERPTPITEHTFGPDGVFDIVTTLVKETLVAAKLDAAQTFEGVDVGTANGSSFINFLEGYDSIIYLQESNGAVTSNFAPQGAFDQFLKAIELDNDFEAPYDALVQLARMCTQAQIGTFDSIKDALTKAAELITDDYKAFFALGELFAAIGDGVSASTQFEKALAIEPNEAAIYTRLGLAQMQAGMPVNAERNLRKAVEMEQDENKPSLEYLAQVLTETGRGHEVPALWKAELDKATTSAILHARYAMSLIANGNTEAGEKAFEDGLAQAEEPVYIKRAYAPYLAHVKNEIDRALDFFEDAIDVNPTDVQLLLEYAETLDKADREVDLPEVLNQILSISQDPNIRSQVMARLIEIEQPKRVESVQRAENALNEGDFVTAARELKPLKTWLADYWKFWYFYAVALNRVEDYAEAENAIKQLLGMFPSCEPAYEEFYIALSKQGKNEEAYGTLRMAAANLPPSLSLHLTLARAAKSAGHADEARMIANQIREAVGENQDVEKVLAEIEL